MGAANILKNNFALIEQFVRDEQLAQDDIFKVETVHVSGENISFVVRYDSYSEETLHIDSLDLMGYIAAKSGIIQANKDPK